MVHSALLILALMATTPSEIDNRVERVVSRLLPRTTLRNRWAAPARLSDRMAYYHTPGLSIAVVNDGRIEWARAFGFAEAGKPLTERTLFQAGSISKPILDPIGLADSTYEQPLPPALAARAATAHPWKGRPLPGRWHIYPEMAAAGLWTTPSDLARAGIEVQKALKGEPAVLTRERAAEMLTPQIQDDMGIGFFLEGKGETMRFGHGGWDEGFVARAVFYKEGGRGAVVMVNSNEGAAILDEVLRAVAKEYAWPGFFEEEKKPAPVAATVLDGYAGDYAGKFGLRVRVAREGDALSLKVGAQPAITLRPESDVRFFSADLDTAVTFQKDTGGAITALTLDQGGRQTSAERAATGTAP